MNRRPSREDLLEMARAMVPRLRQKALQTERDRVIPTETHRAFQGAGFYKVFQPERFGGYEMPISMLVEIGSELGRGCGSSAWIFTNLATQNWIIGMHQPQAQEEVWGNNPDALCASSFPTQGGNGRYVDGGILLNGIWSFASGIDFVDWENLQVFIPKENGPPDHRFVLVPKRNFTIQDDWFVNGLSGTGSKSIVIKDVFVPSHRVLNTQLIYGGSSPGSEINPGPLYKVPPLSVGTKVFSGVALGLARGALELIVEAMSTRLSVGRVKMSELPTVQIRVAEASAEIDAAEALLLTDRDVERMMDCVPTWPSLNFYDALQSPDAPGCHSSQIVREASCPVPALPAEAKIVKQVSSLGWRSERLSGGIVAIIVVNCEAIIGVGQREVRGGGILVCTCWHPNHGESSNVARFFATHLVLRGTESLALFAKFDRYSAPK